MIDQATAEGKANQAIGMAHDLINFIKDPAVLSQFGYNILMRCKFEDIPLCEKDFEGEYFSFGESDFAPRPNHWGVLDKWHNEFPDRQEGIKLAIRSFGLAWLTYLNDSESGRLDWRDRWRGWLVLDSLRAIFLETSNIEAMSSVLDAYEQWRDNDTAIGPPEEIMNRFLYLRGYIEGRHSGILPVNLQDDPSFQNLMLSQRLIIWQLKKLLNSNRLIGQPPTDADDLGARIAEIISQKVNRTPHYIVEAFEENLASLYNPNWYDLPMSVRRLLVQAEYLRSILQESVDSDWAPVVLQYVRAVETMLRQTLGELLDQNGFRGKVPFFRANIEQFRNMLGGTDFLRRASSQNIPHRGELAALGRKLDEIVRSYRNPAVHDAEPTSPIKAAEIQRIVMGGSPGEIGIIWEIARLREVTP